MFNDQCFGGGRAGDTYTYLWGFPDSSVVKNLPAMQETWVRSLALEDSLEEGKVTLSSILTWGIPWTEEPGGLHRVRHD